MFGTPLEFYNFLLNVFFHSRGSQKVPRGCLLLRVEIEVYRQSRVCGIKMEEVLSNNKH